MALTPKCRKELFFAFGGIFSFGYLCLFIFWHYVFLPPPQPQLSPSLPRTLPSIPKTMEATTVYQPPPLPFTSYAINTSTCKIPDFEPWPNKSMSIRWFLNTSKCNGTGEREPKCRERNDVPNWFYSNRSHLIVNHTAIHGDGYSWDGLRCCYQVIQRVQQTLEKYDKQADKTVRLSNQCYELSEPASPIPHEFIRVNCNLSAFNLSESTNTSEQFAYIGFFAFARVDAHANAKISRWMTVPESERPPNVILLGIDTNSRLNSHRQLPKTLEILRQIGAVEMFGYTKIGENTFPNAGGFLAGFSEEELKSHCLNTYSVAQDGCPYIWKDFDRMGYLTALVEDETWGSIFTYGKTGFVLKPTDFYYRTFTIGVARQPTVVIIDYQKCIGHRRVDQVQLDYISDILQLASEQGTPVFIHSWSTWYTHYCTHHVSFHDEPMSEFLRKKIENAPNTVLFFMSDHGERHGHVRQTTMGWYEDKLPTMWIYLSPDLRERFPGWSTAIQMNARRLTSPFELYHTMMQILATFNRSQGTSEALQRKGPTLLEPLPENRTCVDARIPASYCACAEPQIVDVKSEDPRLQMKLNQVASFAISYLREILPPACSTPVLKRIVSAKYLNKVGTAYGALKIYIIAFYSDPGDFLFEATVKIAENTYGNQSFSIEGTNDILRMNTMERKVDCVDDPVLERYCYCP